MTQSDSDKQQQPTNANDQQPAPEGSGGSNVTRRQFIGSTAAAGAAFAIVPSHVLGGPNKTAPSDQLTFLQIGCGGKGNKDRKEMLNQGAKLIGMCDPDKKRASGAFKNHPEVPKFDDYRKMLDKLADKADAVTVTTPDHLHGVQAVSAVRRGLHAYVQKPLTRTYHEAEVLREEANRQGVVVQMGNQGHSGNGLKLWERMGEENAFGDIESLHVWTARPGDWWPQGMDSRAESEPVPDHMSWDDWIGPQKHQPYSSAYAPFKWRGWWDFGCGAMGDMACHNADPAFWILNLGEPTEIRAKASSPAGVAYPDWTIVEMDFPATDKTGKPVTLTWYDGGKKPSKPEGAHPGLSLGGEGCMVVGKDMVAMGGSHAGTPRPIAIPGKEFGKPVKKAEKHWRNELKKLSNDNHYARFVNAIKAGDPSKASSEVNYAAPLTQAMLLGCIATRYPGKTLKWDSKKQQFTNHSEANRWLTFNPQNGHRL
jgi:predicted dehydrogenase